VNGDKLSVKIECTGTDFLSLEKVVTIQGDLKVLSTADAERLEASILKHGFMAPIFIWEKKLKSGSVYSVLDGTQRITVLRMLEKKNYIIPKLPVVYIKAKSLKDAKEKLLYISSQFGQMTLDSVIRFASELEVDWGAFRLSAGELELRDVEIEDYKEIEEDDTALNGWEDVAIILEVPEKYREQVEQYLANGFDNTGPGRGKGVLKLCGLL
jgi:hypothetical protein